MSARGTHVSRRGISLVETLVGLGVFAVIAASVYQSYTTLLRVFTAARIQFLAASVAEEQMEVIRNMPYEQVGVQGGVPSGIIPQVQVKTKDNLAFYATTTIRNIDDPFDGVACPEGGETCGGEEDTSPADYKLVEILVACVSCGNTQVFQTTGRVSPKTLEAASTNGSLFIQVINASGQPVQGADVHVVNTTVNPAVNFFDSTGSDGFLRIIDTPPALQSYQITVSKSGYSSDQTHAMSTENPNPVKPYATVAAQQVTQVSFAIDSVSQVNFTSLTESCSPVPNITGSLTGSKLIGTNPNVLKHSPYVFVTGGGSSVLIGGLEWDTYSVSTTPQQFGYDLRGTIPFSPFALPPAANQNFKVIMKQGSPNALLVTVRDAATGLPLTGASVTLTGGTSVTQFTGRGFLSQTDWSGGSGQANFVNQAMYAADDGNVDVTTAAGEVRLKIAAGGAARSREPRQFVRRAFAESPSPQYVPAGTLTSSTFDTGSASNFYNLTFQPASQPPDTGPLSVRFQFAATNTPDATVWNFVGPDGTAGTYFTAGNANVNAAQDGNRYVRYKMYLSTASTTLTPSISDVYLTFASECVPPGQVLFQGVAAGTYNITVSLPGYATVQDQVSVVAAWQGYEVVLVPTGGGGGGAPVVQTENATDIGVSGATLGGLVNPNGFLTAYWFEYGPSPEFGDSTVEQSIGSGSEPIQVSDSVSGLEPATTYYFRVVASNSFGTSYGLPVLFTTSGGGGLD